MSDIPLIVREPILISAPPPLTPWFPSNVKPIRLGYYVVDLGHKRDDGSPVISLAWWQGDSWVTWTGFCLRWRGLSAPMDW